MLGFWRIARSHADSLLLIRMSCHAKDIFGDEKEYAKKIMAGYKKEKKIETKDKFQERMNAVAELKDNQLLVKQIELAAKELSKLANAK